MDTNRIDNLFGLTSKTATARLADKDVGAKTGGFADLLFGVMSQRADNLALDQIKAATNTTTASLRSGRGLPSSSPNAGQRNDLTAPLSRQDRHIDRDRVASGKSDDSAVKTSQSLDDRPATPVRTDRKQDAITKRGCDDQQVDDVAEGEMLDTGSQVDAATETDLPDDSQDAGLGTDGGDTGADGGKRDEPDQSAEPQAGLALVASAVPVDETVVTREIGTDVVPQVNPTTPDTATKPSADIGEAAALAATASLPDIADIASSGQDAAPESSIGASAKTDEAADTAKPAVTFAATVALATSGDLDATDAEAQKVALTADNERQLEDPGNLFRRNNNGGRKTASVGQGATQGTNGGAHPGAQNNAQATPDLHAAVTQASAGSTAGSAATLSTVAPIGFDSGLGTSTGLPGWNLHLAQGSAIRRGDFVASLRQHLQNLPVHDQVALSIQRSLRDGNGSITLQLSPTELGRIHVKLDIDEENNVQASVMVERPATLDLLQRDMKALERALQEAGLKAGPGDLSFSLQGGDPEAFARDFGSGNGTGSGGSGLAADNGADDLPATTAAPVIATGDGWVDVQV